MQAVVERSSRMTGAPKDKISNAFGKLVRHMSGELAGEKDGPEEKEALEEFQLERDISPFDSADDLERGFMAEAVLAKNALIPAPRDTFRRCCIFHLEKDGAPTDEFHLLSESGDMLMVAKWVRREHRVDFFLMAEEVRGTPQPPSPTSPSKRPRPAFTMSYSESNDNWFLKQTSCKHCVQRPQHISCDALGKSQQLAFIQHGRRKVGKALVHCVDVKIPALVAGVESMVWCPVTLGRDLCDRSPAPGVEPMSPGQRRVVRGSPKEANRLPQGEEEDQDPLRLGTKLPTWDESLNHLVLNFGDRRPVSSPMNFMLIDELDEDKHMVMLHAKLSANTFCLDFKNPLNTIQAFGVALTALLWD